MHSVNWNVCATDFCRQARFWFKEVPQGSSDHMFSLRHQALGL